MSYKVIAIAKFEKDIKRLAKKYPSLKKEYIALVGSLRENPTQGTPLANHCYKIRVAIASKGKGRSGGARVITFIHVIQESVYLLSMYDKSEQDILPEKELKKLVSSIKDPKQ